jgi:hypothetical protein
MRGLEPLGQLFRLNQFRARNPSVVINRDTGFGFWQAWIPVSNGGTVITRYLLQDLLDKLEEVLSPERSHDSADRSKARNAAPGYQEYRR